MVRHLERDYEMETKPSGLVPHFWDTIEVLGGWKGMCLLSFGIMSFYFIVVYFVTSGRKKREAKKEAKTK